MRILPAVIFAALPAALAATPWDGSYLSYNDWVPGTACEARGNYMSHMDLVGEGIVWIEGECRLQNPRPVPSLPSALAYDSQCWFEAVEGEPHVAILMPVAEGLALITNGSVELFHRCE